MAPPFSHIRGWKSLFMMVNSCPEIRTLKNLNFRRWIIVICGQLPRCSGPSRTVAYGFRRSAVPSASLTVPARRCRRMASGRKASRFRPCLRQVEQKAADKVR